MSIADDLLALSERLARPGPEWPRKACYRRAVSTAYYAIFHLLIEEFARLFVRDDADLLGRITRTVDHKPLKEASSLFSKPQITLPKSLQPKNGQFDVPQDLQTVALAVLELQEEREEADYDRTRAFTASDVRLKVDQVKAAFEAWERIRRTDAARLYLACLLLRDSWNKSPR